MKIDNDIDASGTSFHGTTIRATAKQMIAALGDPKPYCCSKTTHEWSGKVNDQIFTVYDWKEGYFTPDTPIDWHIGGFDAQATEDAKEAIFELLVTMPTKLMKV